MFSSNEMKRLVSLSPFTQLHIDLCHQPMSSPNRTSNLRPHPTEPD